MRQLVEYDRTPVSGVTHLISVGEDPGTDSITSILAKSAVVGAGSALAMTALHKQDAAGWTGLAAFGLALMYFAAR